MRVICSQCGILLAVFLLPFCVQGRTPDLSKLREGDIIFQETRSGQARALKLVTRSRYTHVGIIFKNGRRLYVLEAVQPVRTVGIQSFINKGVHRHFVVRRLINAERLLTRDKIRKMKAYGRKFLGKNYDLYFGWSDNRIYCSELVWKIYKNVLGVEIGNLQRLGDFDLTHPYVKKILRKRYGGKIPYDEKVISVGTMFDSPNLKTVLQFH